MPLVEMQLGELVVVSYEFRRAEPLLKTDGYFRLP